MNSLIVGIDNNLPSSITPHMKREDLVTILKRCMLVCFFHFTHSLVYTFIWMSAKMLFTFQVIKSDLRRRKTSNRFSSSIESIPLESTPNEPLEMSFYRMWLNVRFHNEKKRLHEFIQNGAFNFWIAWRCVETINTHKNACVRARSLFVILWFYFTLKKYYTEIHTQSVAKLSAKFQS